MAKPGKKKEKSQKDEKQTKISAFFENKPPMKAEESKLFTSVYNVPVKGAQRLTSVKDRHRELGIGATSKHRAAELAKGHNSKFKQSKEKDDDDVVFIDAEEPVPCMDEKSKDRKTILLCRDDKSDTFCRSLKVCEENSIHNISNTLGYKHSEKHNSDSLPIKCGSDSFSQVKNRSDKNHVACYSQEAHSFSDEVLASDCVQATSFETAEASFTTPTKQAVQGTSCEGSDSSPDIICETPNVDRVLGPAAVRRKNAQASRSFLCPKNLLGVQPGLKPAHLRMKQLRGASSLAGKVSISFTPSLQTGEPSAGQLRNVSMDVDIDTVQNDTTGPTSCLGSQLVEHASLTHIKPFQDSLQKNINMGKDETAVKEKPEIPHPDMFCIPETQFCDVVPDLETKSDSEEDFEANQAVGRNCQMNIQPQFQPTDKLWSPRHKEAIEQYIKEVDSASFNDLEFRPNGIMHSNPNKATQGLATEVDFISNVNKIASKTSSLHTQTVRNGTDPTFEIVKTRSKLIDALEAADSKAEIKEENLWMAERLMKHFSSDDFSHSMEEQLQDPQTTPVKVYGEDKHAIKRQAKPGLSPCSKRQLKDSFTNLKDEASMSSLSKGPWRDTFTKTHSLESLGPDTRPTKGRLTENRAYQFGFKKKGNLENRKVTLENDKLLSELLGQLKSPSKSESKATSHALKELNPFPKLAFDKERSSAAVFSKNSKMCKEMSAKPSDNIKSLLQNDIEILHQLFGQDVPDSEEPEQENSTVAMCTELPVLQQDFGRDSKASHTFPNNFLTSNESAQEDAIVILDDTQNMDVENSECFIVEDNSDNCLGNPSRTAESHKTCESHEAPEPSSVFESHNIPESQDSHTASHKITERHPDLNQTTETLPVIETYNTKEILLPDSTPHISYDFTSKPFKATSPLNVITECDKHYTGLEHKPSDRNKQTTVSNFPYTMISEASSQQYVSIRECAAEESRQAAQMSHNSDFTKGDFDDDSTWNINSTIRTTDLSTEFKFTDLWNRFTVLDVVHDRAKDEVCLTLACSRTRTVSHCNLRGFWTDTVVCKDDTVNIVGSFNNNLCIIDDKHGLVIVNPDLLLSGTLVVSSTFCARKSVLNEKFKGVDGGNIQMLHGSVIHSLFQSVLKEGVRDEKAIWKMAVALLRSNKFLHEMYSQGVQDGSVMEEIGQYIPSLISWLTKHTPAPGQAGRARLKESDVLIQEIHDIEENIWSPRFGLKGKIDVTVKARLRKPNNVEEVKILPLELKTGKASFSHEHNGQVMLYSMMSSDRREDPEEGILLYLKHGQMETVPVKPQSQSGLIQLRNNLAHYLAQGVRQETTATGQLTYQLGQLPQPINNQKACSRCAHLLNCSIYQRAVDHVVHQERHAMSVLVPEALQHLTEMELSYFTHWMLCLDLEQQESQKKHLSQIWRASSLERERNGECLGNLMIAGSELDIPESQCFNEGRGCSLTFTRDPSQSGTPLDTVGLVTNDMVVISSEDGRYIALATGFVRRISHHVVEVVVDRDYLHDTSAFANLRFRLDKNDSFSTSGYLCTNLSRLMESNPRATYLRDLIIKLRPPEFELQFSKSNFQKVAGVLKPLNKQQRRAILKVLMCKDYVLIKGFPGTGKTATIVALVKILHLIGQSVLLTSYTHSAVDNILLKLKESDIPFLRLGRRGRIHPLILPHSAEVLTSSTAINTVQELKKFYNSYDVVATSALGVNHPMFKQRQFDLCIVDEASQVLQPACLGPLFHCRKFVLVGDPKQLPPVVQSRAARNLRMDESLFARLDDTGATYDLCLQYRMNRVIMELSNSLVYEGKLQCGSSSVAEQCCHFNESAILNCPSWMKNALSCSLERSVVFVDTGKVSCAETSDGKGITNVTEAELVVSLVRTLIKANVSEDEIGVISPYRSQVRLIKQKILGCGDLLNVEVNTVDQYQGRDKSIIAVSFVRSQSAGELLKDLRRLNVALTRARHKLILIGSASALKSYEHVANILSHLEATGNIIEVTDM
ncbi:unnamed protein product [Candidula unifasciata]|uniref:DNA replication ATP-dependent helicase/nuclease DNA2 n=1 Tax=Candidula unifasciata TaxID=100452 RepID=A0A8S4A2A0_9EUPU|nr:unnamed protein product [Candidula unifasciata]